MIIMKNNTKIAVVGVGGFVAGVLVDHIINERKSKQIVEKMDDLLDDLDDLAQEDELQSEFKTENDTSSTESDTDEKKGDEINE